MSSTRSDTDWCLRGYKDFQEQTPWQRAPEHEHEWDQSPEMTAYWQGFAAAAKDTYAKIGRAHV